MAIVSQWHGTAATATKRMMRTKKIMRMPNPADDGFAAPIVVSEAGRSFGRGSLLRDGS
jgi:hypothetical protein